MKKSSLSDNQIKELKAILTLDPGFTKQGKVGTFIDLWLVCEVLAKKYIMYHKQLSESPYTWKYTQLTAALKSFSVPYDSEKVIPAFKSGHNGRRGSKTARQLRNGFLHTLSANDRKEIEARNGELATLLRYWKKKLSNSTK